MYEAPEKLRRGVYLFAQTQAERSVDWIRTVVCSALLEHPDPNNWSEGNVLGEIEMLVRKCSWHKVYDIAEAIYKKIEKEVKPSGPSYRTYRNHQNPQLHQVYENSLNQLMLAEGIGWQMIDGKFAIRGEPAQELLKDQSDKALDDFPVAQKELRETFADLSKRPELKGEELKDFLARSYYAPKEHKPCV